MVENPYLGRFVTLLTPVFAGLAGYIAQLAAQYLPGTPDLDETALTAVFVAGAGAAITTVYKWLDNRGKYEERQELLGSTPAPDVVPVE
jgi:hypothetical protein